MEIDILTIFPDYFYSPLRTSIIKRAIERGLVCINLHDLRDYTEDESRRVDDYPYGGGAGMVLKPEPIFKALEKLEGYKILLTPRGILFNQKIAKKLIDYKNLIFISGRYEGVDERVSFIVDMELSIGDYILSGGEVACLVVLETIIRLIPQVLGNPESIKEESFSDDNNGLLSYPVYTRPPEYKGYTVPPVLLSGNHQKIRLWRREKAIEKTLINRPDLLKTQRLTKEREEKNGFSL